MENEKILILKKSQCFLGALSLGTVAIFLKCFVYPFKRGFFCDDQSIRYPAHSSTISSWNLYLYIISSTLLVMVLCEYNRGGEEGRTLKLGAWSLPPWALELFGSLGDYWFGVVSCELVTLVSKLATGRLRPHFMEVCDPQPPCRPGDSLRYVDPRAYSCSRGESEDVVEARKSFPSGHASLSAFTALYLCFYLEARMDQLGRKVVKHVLQVVLVTMSMIIGFTRISDNKHHWSDVAAGFFLGIVLATINALYISSLFAREQTITVVPKAVKR